MPAVIKIARLNGSDPTINDITNENTRIDYSDNVNISSINTIGATTNPIPIPLAAGPTAYSYWCSTQLNCINSPAVAINTVKWSIANYNFYNTGNTLTVGQVENYVQASVDTQLNGTNYTGFTTGGTTGGYYIAPGGWTGATLPMTVTNPNYPSPYISNPSIGLFGYIVAMQFAVIHGASPGASGFLEITWTYDEI